MAVTRFNRKRGNVKGEYPVQLVMNNSVGNGGVNEATDVMAVQEAFNEIPAELGAPSSVLTVDGVVTQELIDAIINFQAFQQLPVVDGLINPNKATHQRINQILEGLALAAPMASVASLPESLAQSVGPENSTVADPASLAGLALLQRQSVSYQYQRRLVSVSGSSIKWFGVVLPSPLPSDGTLGVPHLFFTPTPIQGGYIDSNYPDFIGWNQLWDDYTSIIGFQLIASAVKQVLVIPFYRTAQQQDLGSFLTNWQAVTAAVIAAAVDSVDPFYLQDSVPFDSIVSSSFSNGWVAHREFNTKAVGAAAMTTILFDLDGVTAQSTWQPPNGVIYRNQSSPLGVNPDGMNWYVGGRWSQFASLYPAGSFNTHACCRNHLLYHGLTTFCP
jgi:peptidoglycan hydrolase-like protein with peptidoglycan-binding domain